MSIEGYNASQPNCPTSLSLCVVVVEVRAGRGNSGAALSDESHD